MNRERREKRKQKKNRRRKKLKKELLGGREKWKKTKVKKETRKLNCCSFMSSAYVMTFCQKRLKSKNRKGVELYSKETRL